VTVQDVLDRASVGRSTFYLHYRDKDDLLLSQLEMFLETMSYGAEHSQGRIASSCARGGALCAHRKSE
jgi:AcrR family transcriptional regulator